MYTFLFTFLIHFFFRKRFPERERERENGSVGHIRTIRYAAHEVSPQEIHRGPGSITVVR